MFELFDEADGLLEALPEGFVASECDGELTMRVGLDGGYGETRLYAWRGRLVGAWRASIMAPFEPLALAAPARLERDGLNTTLVLELADRRVELPVMLADRDAIAALLEHAPEVFPLAAPAPPEEVEEVEDVAAPAAPAPPEEVEQAEEGGELAEELSDEDFLDDLTDELIEDLDEGFAEEEREVEPPAEEEPAPRAPRPESVDALPSRARARLGTRRLRRWGRGASDHITALGFTDEGRQLLAMCSARDLRAWSMEDGDLSLVLDAGSGAPVAMATSGSGRTAAVAYEGGHLVVWNALTGEERTRFTLDAELTAVAFSPEASWLVAGRADGHVQLWGVGDASVTRLEAGSLSPITQLDVTADAERVLGVTEAGELFEWRRRERATPRRLSAPGVEISQVELSPSGERIAIVNYSRVEVRDASMQRVLCAPQLSLVGEPAVLLWGRDEDTLFVGDEMLGRVDILDVSRDTILQTIDFDMRVTALALSPDGRALAGAGELIQVRRLPHDEPFFAIGRHKQPITSVHIAPDGREVVTADAEGRLLGWDVASGRVDWELHDPEATASRISHDERTLAVGRHDEIALWDTHEDRQRAALPNPDELGPRHLWFSPDDRWLAAITMNDRLWVFDLERRRVREITAAEAGVDVMFTPADMAELAFAPGGAALATADRLGFVTLWDRRTGRSLRSLHAHEGGVEDVTFAGSGALLATVGADGAVRLWDSDTFMELFHWDFPTRQGRCVAFSPSGDLLAAGGRGGVLALWDLDSGDEVARVHAHDGAITSIDFARDQHILVTSSEDGSALVWDVDALTRR